MRRWVRSWEKVDGCRRNGKLTSRYIGKMIPDELKVQEA
jgi:hypothetical protein